MLFSLKRGSLGETWPRILLATFVSLVVTLLVVDAGQKWLKMTPVPFTILGVAISIFLGFRNTTAYGRFWEGRIQWGGLVNTSRTLTRQVLTLVGTHFSESVPGRPGGAVGSVRDEALGLADPDPDPEVRTFHREVTLRLIAYVHALRHHLRGTDPTDDVSRYLTAAEVAGLAGQRNVPLAVLQGIGDRLLWARRRGWVHAYHAGLLEESLRELTNIQGACERIRNTPVPATYTILSHRLVVFFCFALPFGIVESAGHLTPFVVFLVSHAFFGMDAIGEEVEEPFGTHPHDLPLHQLSRLIEVNLLQMLGTPADQLPEIPKPVNDILL
jgi:putative membrane protein